MGYLNFNSASPAAPGGRTNILFAKDSSFNISASILTPIYAAAANTIANPTVFNSNLGTGGATARQQLSVGAGLDLYSGSANSPAVPSVRGTALAPYLNAFGSGSLSLNYDSGSGGTVFYNGSGTQSAAVDTAGTGWFYGLSVAGGQAVVQGVANPGALTVTTSGTAGTTSYSYAVTAIQSDGSTTGPSPATAGSVISTGNAGLSSTNYNVISWAAVANAVGYNVYRLTSGGTPSSIGKIASAVTATTFNDTGYAGDGTLAAAVRALPNNTGVNLTSPVGGNMGGWTTYLPTFTQSSASYLTTISVTAVTDAQYLVVGPVCHVKIYCTLALSGLLNSCTGIYATLPMPVVGATSAMSLSQTTVSANAGATGIAQAVTGQSYAVWMLNAAAGFSNTSYYFIFSGFYRCA